MIDGRRPEGRRGTWRYCYKRREVDWLHSALQIKIRDISKKKLFLVFVRDNFLPPSRPFHNCIIPLLLPQSAQHGLEPSNPIPSQSVSAVLPACNNSKARKMS